MLRRKPKRAAVFGCGPAGMFATHAFIQAGWDVTIFSNKRRSEMFGAQYLHKPIPGLAGFTSPSDLDYTVRGTDEQYSAKVYGDKPPPFVSPARLEGMHEVWDIRSAYYDAFARYEDRIVHQPGVDSDMIGLFTLDRSYGQLVSTIPATEICWKVHQFSVAEIWAIGDAPERGVFAPSFVDPMRVVCDGTSNISWYRAANVFGYKSVEWPADTKPPIPGVVSVRKPISTQCDCWAGSVLKLGRYGTWSKGVYSHSAYYDVKEMLA